MTRDDYFELARGLAREAGAEAYQSYFELHRERLWETIESFDLASRHFENVLCIGPYFDYTPFLFEAYLADAVSVLEADPPTALLEPLYAARGIEFVRKNLFDLFAASTAEERRLPWPDDTFDLVCCWETIEHFNFNPVPFVRELHRVTRPGGWVCTTVPNVARLDARLQLLAGMSIQTPVEQYQDFAGREYYGFHWREYTLSEFTRLFGANAFEIGSARHLTTFQNRPLSVAGRTRRIFARAITRAVPAFGSVCAVKAVKPNGTATQP